MTKNNLQTASNRTIRWAMRPVLYNCASSSRAAVQDIARLPLLIYYCFPRTRVQQRMPICMCLLIGNFVTLSFDEAPLCALVAAAQYKNASLALTTQIIGEQWQELFMCV